MLWSGNVKFCNFCIQNSLYLDMWTSMPYSSMREIRDDRLGLNRWTAQRSSVGNLIINLIPVLWMTKLHLSSYSSFIIGNSIGDTYLILLNPFNHFGLKPFTWNMFPWQSDKNHSIVNFSHYCAVLDDVLLFSTKTGQETIMEKRNRDPLGSATVVAFVMF